MRSRQRRRRGVERKTRIRNDKRWEEAFATPKTTHSDQTRLQSGQWEAAKLNIRQVIYFGPRILSIAIGQVAFGEQADRGCHHGTPQML